ncbi:hypothetical protein AVEN_147581-1 [Araneus ventricosus]|uniref:Uncharacterized protein n=1 Tax=Araneus ventricosus TaxID=182803 RepID=A0A4Y2H6Q6_ARAVE|nr:hypothetical protein AVEN_147581-1 [Araneus ventricosus]
MLLESVFDHPLFGWSNYDDNKSPTTVLERRTWALGTGLLYLFALEKLTIEKEFFFLSLHFLANQIFFYLRGPLAIGQAGNLDYLKLYTWRCLSSTINEA